MFTTEAFGHLVVERVTPFGPASKAGIEDGDVLLTIAGEPVGSLPDLYRKIWRLGEAGVEVPLRVFRQGVSYDITVKSASRYDFLRLRRSY
jgi:S1-C subfamily serine protease